MSDTAPSRQDAVPAGTREVDATYEFSVATAPHAAYKTKDGGALVFFAYSSREQANAPRGGTLRVEPTGSPDPRCDRGGTSAPTPPARP